MNSKARRPRHRWTCRPAERCVAGMAATYHVRTNVYTRGHHTGQHTCRTLERHGKSRGDRSLRLARPVHTFAPERERLPGGLGARTRRDGAGGSDPLSTATENAAPSKTFVR